MKIVFISDDFPPDSFGGAGIIASHLANGLIGSGHEVIVLTTVRDPNDVGEVVVDSLKIIKLYSNYSIRYRNYFGVLNPFLVCKVGKLLRNFQPDIVHAHNIHQHFSFAVLKIAKKYSKAVFLTAHDSQLVSTNKVYPHHGNTNYRIREIDEIRVCKFRYNPLRRILIRYYLKFVDRIFAVSNSLKECLATNGIKNMSVIYNGIDISNWTEMPSVTFQFENNHNKKIVKSVDLLNMKVILYSGRLSGGKGSIQILHILKKLLVNIPNAYLLVLGKSDGYGQSMIDVANDLNVINSVGFTGWISGDTIRKAYQLSQVVVLPSIYLDPFPTINLEAMAMGRPVVGTCFGGTIELVEHEVTGYIEDPLNIDGFSGKIAKLLSDEDLRTKLGKNGKKRVKDLFSIDIQVQKTLNEYNKYIETNGRRK